MVVCSHLKMSTLTTKTRVYEGLVLVEQTPFPPPPWAASWHSDYRTAPCGVRRLIAMASERPWRPEYERGVLQNWEVESCIYQLSVDCFFSLSFESKFEVGFIWLLNNVLLYQKPEIPRREM